MNPASPSQSAATGNLPATHRPFYLAPLRGVTDVIYRRTYAEHFSGIDLAVAPFVTTHAGRRIKPAHVRDLQPEENRKMPVVPQVLTKSADDFITLADHLFDMGYGTLNLNCGCPFPQVANKGRGSGLLCDPDGLDRLLDKVLSHIPNRLSIKTRLGRHDAAEIRTVMPIFNRYPLESVIVHPRTGSQMYAGTPDLAAFEWCLAACRHPVIYNGDITDLAGFHQLERRFESVAGWMLGRGVLANPFLPGLLKNTTTLEAARKTDRFRQFHDALFERYRIRLSGPGHLLDRMKGLWKYFAQGFQDSETARKRIHKARSIEQYRDAVAAFLDSGLEWMPSSAPSPVPVAPPSAPRPDPQKPPKL
jgi:tRNA-dihydrouridine synthase